MIDNIVLTLAALLSTNAASAGDIPLPVLAQYQDKNTAGWAYKLDDQAFELQEPGCSVKWNVETSKDPKQAHAIFVRENCPGKFERALQLNQAIFKAVVAKYPKEKLGSVGAISWCDRPEWIERIVVAGAKEFQGGKKKPVDADFEKLFQKANVAMEDVEFFASQGLDFTISNVEKVLFKRFKEFEFASKYPEFSKYKTPLPFKGMCWFRLASKKK